ncbi:unnamed protein product [Caenorhabditis brenneri]
MLKTFIIALCLGANVHAGSVTPTSTTTAQEDVELAKLATTCLSSREYEEIGGNIVRHGVMRTLSIHSVSESIAAIGLAELRAALNFSPLPPWQNYNTTDPSEEELSAAPTIEAYYDLKEPRSRERSLNSTFLLEQNMIPAITFLDKKFPVIRSMFKRRFGEILQQNPGLTDRKMVDRLIDEFEELTSTARRAIIKMNLKNLREECLDY